MKHLIFSTILFAFLTNGYAQSNENKFQGSLSVYHAETRLGENTDISCGPLEFQVHINWAMWTLMGEPVYNVNAAVELRTHALIATKDGRGYGIPKEVLHKIRPVKITIYGNIFSLSSHKTVCHVKWDAGAPGKLYTEQYKDFKDLSKEEQKKYYSFNVAGSTDWDKFFYYTEGNYVRKNEAVEFFKSKIKMNDARAEIEWDLTPVKSYIAQQERLALDKKRAELDKQKQELDKKQQEREQAQKQKEEEDFWNTPASTETRDDAVEREAYKQAEDQLQSRYDEIDDLENKIENEKERYDLLLADKREELEKRPKPGDKQGYFTDSRDGKRYRWVKIGKQVWMAENLNIGTMINVYRTQTNNGTIEKYCYGDNTSNCDTYGGLYQWDEAMQYVTTAGTQGICPSGWHIPTDAEWMTLEEYLGMCSGTGSGCSGATGDRGTDEGSKMAGNEPLWTNGNLDQNANFGTSGFDALPGGERSPGMEDTFNHLTYYAFFWSSSEDRTDAWIRYLYYHQAQVSRYSSNKAIGNSVRCVKNK